MRELTNESLKNITPPFVRDHFMIGILLIPFGISTLYSAIGVRVGQAWAHGVALTNAFSIMLMPLIVLLVMGPQYFSSTPFIIAAGLITVIGVTMFIALLWIGIKQKQ